MLKFYHTYLYFKDLIRTYFCGIYVILWDFLEVKITKFLILKMFVLAVCRSTGRSTEAEVGRPVWSTDVHRTCTQPRLGRRSTARELLLSRNGPGRPPDRPTESSALCFHASVDRPVDRKGKIALVSCQRVEF